MEVYCFLSNILLTDLSHHLFQRSIPHDAKQSHLSSSHEKAALAHKIPASTRVFHN